jgi:hypothetical protein
MAMRNLLRVVSVVALVSAIPILHPPDPCFALITFTGNSCTTTGLLWLYLVWGGVSALVGVIGLIVSFRAFPGDPIRMLLVVSVVTFVSGMAILYPSDPCSGLRPMFAASSSCTAGGLNVAYIVWGAIAVLVGLGGVIRAWPSEPIRGGK